MSEFFEKLAHGTTLQPSSEHLKVLGKRAAGLYISKEAGTLTDAVHEVIAEEGDLNQDQVQRVAQMANQETWKSLFVENGDRQVQFEPADADSVLGLMATKPEQNDLSGLGYLEFLQDPVGETPEGDLADAFGIKAEEAEYKALNPVHGEQVEVEKTASARDTARYSVDNVAALLADAGEKLYGLVKRAHLDENCGILQISKAVASAMQDPAFARDTMQTLASRLEHEGVRFNHKEELSKIAHPLVVNGDHPLVKTAAEFERAAFAYYSSEEAHEKLSAAHTKAVKCLRDKLRAQ